MSYDEVIHNYIDSALKVTGKKKLIQKFKDVIKYIEQKEV
jgi:hypothetical protein